MYCKSVNRTKPRIPKNEKRLELLIKSNNQNNAEIDQIKQSLEKAYEEQAKAYKIRAKEKHSLLNNVLTLRRGEQSRSYGHKLNLKIAVTYGICNILKEQCVNFKTLMTNEGINTDAAKQVLANVETSVSQR